jgi:hypothetical protein
MISSSDLSASLTYKILISGSVDNIDRFSCKVFRYGLGNTDPLRVDDGSKSRMMEGTGCLTEYMHGRLPVSSN